MRNYKLILVVLTLMLCFNSAKSWGQDIVNLRHTVQRGETIEILADKYRLTTDMLKAINLGMDTFYTGMEVLVPAPKSERNVHEFFNLIFSLRMPRSLALLSDGIIGSSRKLKM